MVRIPKMTLHKPSGNARVRLFAKDYYLGKWGSPEAAREYKKIIAQYASGALVAKSVRGNLIESS